MSGPENDVVRLRGDQFEWRMNGLELRLDAAATQDLALRALAALEWEQGAHMGLREEGLTLMYSSERQRTDQLERIRASGIGRVPERVARTFIAEPWREEGAESKVKFETPKQRRFGKEPAATASSPAPAKASRRTVKQAVAEEISPVITGQLFEDPEEQLRYEVRHAYLLTVPLSQRGQWPLDETYQVLPAFMEDLAEQSGKSVSRAQIIQTVVDVVSSRVNDVQSRRVHPLRVAPGRVATSGDPIVTRSFDRAVAYRAYVSRGTPQARRIMWWRRPDGGITLARLANHDDMAMPER